MTSVSRTTAIVTAEGANDTLQPQRQQKWSCDEGAPMAAPCQLDCGGPTPVKQ